MNHRQEEHRIRLCPVISSTTRDSFTGLWTSMARQQHFMKLTLADGQTVDQAIHQRDGSISPYSSRVFQTYHILYQKDNTVILTNRLTSPLGTFFVVEDTDCPHRYFIGFAFSVGAMVESITGLIVYFNEQGNCYSDRTIICQHVLATYDIRNGLLRGGYLYHQTLLFTQVHRDTRKLLLYLSVIPYDTDLIENHTSYYTSYTVPFPNSMWGSESISLFKRFLYVPLSDSILLFDLGTLECIEEKVEQDTDPSPFQRYLVIQSYHLSKKEDMLSFLEVAFLFPEKDYSDGYPLECVQCHQKTVAASYVYKRPPYATLQSGLGSSYCPDCHIRYSDSKHQWVCAEIRLDGTLCDGYLLEEIGCRSSALHSSDQTTLVLYEPPFLKYPYRQRIRIQWTPSEEAVACARASQGVNGVDFYATDTPPQDTI